jgi:lauroyl/myristoyl acyltransferase
MTPRMHPFHHLATAWTLRPASYSRVVWALILTLDRLPWPWGEESMSASFVARAFLRVRRLRQALAWAAAQSGANSRRWRLALAVCAHHGRFVARSALVGVRNTDALRRLVEVRGEEHLAGISGGVIFIGFHLGPAGSYLALRVAGHRLTWIGGRGASGAWARDIRERYQHSGESQFFAEDSHTWVRRLHQARRLLRGGESVFISADGEGEPGFTVPLPGSPLSIGRGWLALRRATRAPVLPVLSHMDGRTQIVTIQPALPSLLADPVRDLEACRQALASLLADHVRRFPEHCYSLAFPATATVEP